MTAAAAPAVVQRTLAVRDAQQGIEFAAQVWAPGAAAVLWQPTVPWPLVALSHGGGGSNTLYREVCLHLAARGCLVVAPEHPGSNRRDNRLQGTPQNLQDRPRHLALSIDAVCADAELGPRVDDRRVPGFAPAHDPPGFDREAFHRTLPAEVLAFVQQHLQPAVAAA